MDARSVCILVLLALQQCAAASTRPQCISESGTAVDWWIAYKYPYIPNSKNPSVASGFGYAYMDGQTPLQLTNKRLDTNLNGAVAQTLTQLYTASANTYAWLQYNDEWPNGTESSSYGHLKGQVLFTQGGGFWLIHSVPRWPPGQNAGPYSFPDNEKQYGQTFLCITFASLTTINTIMYEMTMMKPSVYFSNLPQSLVNSVPNMQAVLQKKWITHANSSSYNLVSAAGTRFIGFAKNAAWGEDIYEDLVAPTFDSNLATETWMNGPNPLPTYCYPQYEYSVCNIREVNVSGYLFLETKDHSKWAVSTDTNIQYNYTCFADLNRQVGQTKRGGGAVCFVGNNNVWQTFKSMIVNVDKCN